MKFLLTVGVEQIDSPIDVAEDDIDRWVSTHDASGARFWGERLADASQAKVVRSRRDGASVMDGPLFDSQHHVAGIDIIEADSIDEACQIALDHPMAKQGVLEVRPFFDWKGAI